MRKFAVPLTIITIGLIFPLSVSAEEPEKILDSLRSALQSDWEASKNDASGAFRERGYNLESLLQQLGPESLSDERLAQTIRFLESLKNRPGSPQTASACSSLLEKLRLRHAQQAKARREQFDTVLRSAFLKGMNATTSSAIDAPLTELDELKKQAYTRDSGNFEEDGTPVLNMEGWNAAYQTLIAIQDALMAVESPSVSLGAAKGRPDQPRAKLESATSSYSRELGSLMPRSEYRKKIQAILDRLVAAIPASEHAREDFEKQVLQIVASTRKLEDVASALQELTVLVSRQRELNAFVGEPDMSSQIRLYLQACRDLQTGSAISLRFASGQSSSQNNVLEGIGDVLVKAALARAFAGLPGLSPLEDETVSTYLQRALESSIQASDWQSLSRVMDAAQTLSRTSVLSTSDIAAMRQFLAGVNNQKARQYSSAVACYLAALRSGSQAIPADKIGDMLDALKKDHRIEYDYGVQQASQQESQEKNGRYSMGMPANPAMIRSMNPAMRQDASGPASMPDMVIPSQRQSAPGQTQESPAPAEPRPLPPVPKNIPTSEPPSSVR